MTSEQCCPVAPISNGADKHGTSGTSRTNPKQIRRKKRKACPVCRKVFSSSGNLARHVRIHSNSRPYVCSMCGTAFNQGSSLKRHMEAVHKMGKIKIQKSVTVDNLSDNRRPTLDKNTTHVQSFQKVLAKKHECEYCGKKFVQREHLAVHMRTHTGERPYECDRCGKKFRQGSHLNAHKLLHARPHEFSCEKCGKTFSFLRSLRIHERVHMGDTQCSRDTSEKICRWMGVVKRRNLFEQPLKQACSAVPARYDVGNDVGNSDSVVDAGKEVQEYLTSRKVTPRGYQCPICLKVFKQKKYIPVHMRIHSGERPYTCETCGRKFRQHHHLSRHNEAKHATQSPPKVSLRTKEEKALSAKKIRSHKCNRCGKTSQQPFLLQQHGKRHLKIEQTKGKQICGGEFRNRPNFVKHERSHSGAQPYGFLVRGKTIKQSSHLTMHKKIHNKSSCLKKVPDEPNNHTRTTADLSGKSGDVVADGRTSEGNVRDISQKAGKLVVDVNSGLGKEAERVEDLAKTKKTSVQQGKFGDCKITDANLSMKVIKPSKVSLKDNESNASLKFFAKKDHQMKGKSIVCPICGREFKHRSNFTKHERSHSGARPYACDVCGKTYKQSSHLSRHKKIHNSNDRLKEVHNDSKGHMLQAADLSGKLEDAVADRRKSVEKNCETSEKSGDLVVDVNRPMKNVEDLVHQKYRLPEETEKTSMNQDKRRDCDTVVHGVSIKVGKPSKVSLKGNQYSVCPKVFAAKDDLNAHTLVHSRDKQHESKADGKQFKCRNPARRHAKNLPELHSDSLKILATAKKHGEYTSDHCGEIFTGMSLLRQHKTSHKTGPSKHCNGPFHSQKFKYESNRKTHERDMHTGVRPHKSNPCDKSLENEKNRVDLCDTSPCFPNSACSAYGKNRCPVKMSTASEKTRNVVVHKSLFVETYPRSGNAEQLAKEDINGQRVSENLDGGNRCLGEEDGHVKPKSTASNSEGSKTSVPASLKPVLKPNQCPICLKIFIKSGYLSEHLLVHTREKPHACQTCGKRYRFKHHLRRHAMKSHHDQRLTSSQPRKTTIQKQKSFQCDYCGKTFSKSVLFHQHLRFHDDEKTTAEPLNAYVNTHQIMSFKQSIPLVRQEASLSEKNADSYLSEGKSCNSGKDHEHKKRYSGGDYPSRKRTLNGSETLPKARGIVRRDRTYLDEEQDFKGEPEMHALSENSQGSKCDGVQQQNGVYHSPHDVEQSVSRGNKQQGETPVSLQKKYLVSGQDNFCKESEDPRRGQKFVRTTFPPQDVPNQCGEVNSYECLVEQRFKVKDGRVGKETSTTPVADESKIAKRQNSLVEGTTIPRNSPFSKPSSSTNSKRFRGKTSARRKRFKCDICGKTCRTEYTLSSHRNAHTGINHKCRLCGKVFSVLSQLQRHQASHTVTEEKPFVCNICGKSCKHAGNLNKHVAVVHELRNSSRKSERLNNRACSIGKTSIFRECDKNPVNYDSISKESNDFHGSCHGVGSSETYSGVGTYDDSPRENKADTSSRETEVSSKTNDDSSPDERSEQQLNEMREDEIADPQVFVCCECGMKFDLESEMMEHCMQAH